MATPNLNITEVTESQNQKHITINDGLTKLDEATQDSLSYTITGNTTVTATQFEENFAHVLGGTPGAGFDFDVPATKRCFCVINDSGQNATVQVAGGGGSSVIVANGETAVVYSDGADISSLGSGSSGGTPTYPYDLGMYFIGKPTNAQEVFRMEAVRAFTIPDGGPGSTGESRVASTGNVAFSIRRNGTQFATVTFNISASGTWAFDAASDETFSAGDTLTIIAPATADSTLEDISIFIKGNRS